MVELVIKIDENVFTRLFDNGIQDNEIAVDDICEMARALRTGIPLSEELEKVKDEIIEKYWDCDICKYNGHFNIRGNINDILQIIDKHISELKEEQNGR